MKKIWSIGCLLIGLTAPAMPKKPAESLTGGLPAYVSNHLISMMHTTGINFKICFVGPEPFDQFFTLFKYFCFFCFGSR